LEFSFADGLFIDGSQTLALQMIGGISPTMIYPKFFPKIIHKNGVF
jgi:hypothetical protein